MLIQEAEKALQLAHDQLVAAQQEHCLASVVQQERLRAVRAAREVFAAAGRWQMYLQAHSVDDDVEELADEVILRFEQAGVLWNDSAVLWAKNSYVLALLHSSQGHCTQAAAECYQQALVLLQQGRARCH